MRSKIVYYQQKFDLAQQCFQAILQINPQDVAAQLYCARCEKYQKNGLTEGWEVAEVYSEK
ncbi:MAG: hypothetical protein ACK5QY_10370 [Pseudanabaena sp.]